MKSTWTSIVEGVIFRQYSLRHHCGTIPLRHILWDCPTPEDWFYYGVTEHLSMYPTNVPLRLRSFMVRRIGTPAQSLGDPTEGFRYNMSLNAWRRIMRTEFVEYDEETGEEIPVAGELPGWPVGHPVENLRRDQQEKLIAITIGLWLLLMVVAGYAAHRLSGVTSTLIIGAILFLLLIAASSYVEVTSELWNQRYLAAIDKRGAGSA